MQAVCSGTRGRGWCGWSDITKPPEITAPTPLSTFRLTHSPTVSGRCWDGISMAREVVEGYALEYELVQHPGAAGEPLVFLHHGFGSLSTWKDFPAQAAHRLGREALLYSRAGCGNSDPLRAPRTRDYLFQEAEAVLPQLLDRLGLTRVVLFGHSDGATISLLFAAACLDRVAAAVIEAPHVIIEPITVEGVTAVARHYEQEAEFRERVARHHTDPGGAFWSWAKVWRDPAQRSWSMVDRLGQGGCPPLLGPGGQGPHCTPQQPGPIQEEGSWA